MQNKVPTSLSKVLRLAGDMAAGAKQYGGTIPLLQVTEAILLGKLTPLAEAVLAREQAKKELSTRRATTRTLVNTSRAFLTEARDSFKKQFGNQYNQAWDITGLTTSTTIPFNEGDVIELLRSFKGFMASNPGFETESKGITSVRAEELFTQIEAARVAVQLQEKLLSDMATDRDAKAEALRKCARDMIRELTIRLTPLDSRWLAFGLNKPGAVATPEVPEGVMAVLVGPTAASVKWGQSARADHYRVWMRIVGATSQEWLSAGSAADLDLTLEGLPSNSQVEVAVSAVNTSGESARSAIAVVTTLA